LEKKIQKDDEKIEPNGKLEKLESEKIELNGKLAKLEANLDQAVDKDTVHWYREQISKKEDQLTEVMKQISGLQNQTPAGSSLLFSSLLFSSLLFSSLLFFLSFFPSPYLWSHHLISFSVEPREFT